MLEEEWLKFLFPSRRMRLFLLSKSNDYFSGAFFGQFQQNQIHRETLRTGGESWAVHTRHFFLLYLGLFGVPSSPIASAQGNRRTVGDSNKRRQLLHRSVDYTPGETRKRYRNPNDCPEDFTNPDDGPTMKRRKRILPSPKGRSGSYCRWP